MSRKKQQSNPARLADFLFEAAMLRRTPRSGFQFLGTRSESVAEHSFGAAVAGFVLAAMARADGGKVASLCLFHDLQEARTGDCNHVNKKYMHPDDERAFHDAVAGTGMEDSLLSLRTEWDAGQSRESVLARDADVLDLMLRLKEEMERGNPHAATWLERAEQRLESPEAMKLAAALLAGDSGNWWRSMEGPR